MEKVVRDGKVAVLVSPGFGAGWYTWNSEHTEILFHPKIVEMVENGKAGEIDDNWMLHNTGISDMYCGGAADLEIHWLPIGTAFGIDDYDGNETLQTLGDLILVA